ncbi:methyltransferase domain-containing protein [Parvularcula sp. ZS-1/3]|uniref:Methyltransferase domain-containing protein n=1 Tax=Parvularcula mediterranea TaxID=2732508 RepID=A0A7Y3RLL5_9PROT|nr:50S ribosomal protein L11 methyltransferase [Parvularcula mediterranea]NNU16353.1 methyltransferase domain-containing protein [Parvularcula mediterranea]
MIWKTTWSGDRALLEQIETILTEVAMPSVDAVSLVRDDDASAEPEDAPWLLHVYTEDKISRDILAILPEGTPKPEEEELEDRDWVAHSLEGLGIVEAGPFLLYGSHDADKIEGRDGIPLQIEANQAFGTGHHPTTAGCLEAFDHLLTAPTKVLDIGTGSGVLAIAARRLYEEALIVATDIDEPSVAIAEVNATTNGTPRVRFGIAAGTDSPLIQDNAPYDLIFANILAGPLKELSPDIAAVAADNATVILAGLLDEQMASVQSVYEENGFKLRDVRGTERWPVLILTIRKTA